MPKTTEFNEAYWAKAIQKPDWYLEFNTYQLNVRKNLAKDKQELDQFHKASRHFFELSLKNGAVALGSSGPDLDAERKPVDTIVIHHTSHTPGYRLSYLNAVHLLNIYVPYYAKPTIRSEEDLKGQPLWSGHFKDGHQVFWGYTWFMGMDGSFTRLLENKDLGWQAGNWEINKRSVGICLDNDYENQDPDNETLRKLAAHLKKHYPQVKSENIIGHCEARESSDCPGKNFLYGWKDTLVKYFADED